MTWSDKRVIVYAPFAKDSKSLVDLLATKGLNALSVTSLSDVVKALGDDLGAVLMSEEALFQDDWSDLVEAVNAQPTWSSYPFILLIGQKRSSGQTEAVYKLFPLEVANVMVLERPMSSTALFSAVQWALAGRRRQFVTKNHLDELERNARLQRVMTRELAHRVKNTIAMLQSIVTQTLRPVSSLEDLQTRIVERFSALARTHDLLLNTDFQEADFRDLVLKTLNVHGQNFEVSGPAVRFSPQAALSFTLVIHELATNSIKYGALSQDGLGGKVDVSWKLQDAGGVEQFSFYWKESGGPEVREPTAKGFGSRLVRATLGGLGTIEQIYPQEGFRLTFSGPLQGLTHSVVPDMSS
ncbi:MAG: sensor histidine kinase [Candidatus Devosia phytovorans]|uniref:histidine kinase n=1 Tax=Candidatus Devosia phytovorans TaxID=3121372 RepID=A0AAJ6AYT0_9HYPH|nr:sensor histidine kinase [Devosia sp.]WEK03247.1 MAG: sensor histidine kinase [Devosia sp.]